MVGIASFSGLASGVQWADLVEQMINLERVRKVTPLTDQVQAAQNRKSAWSSYESLLSKLNTAASPIRDRSAFGILKTSATTSPIGSKSLISATAGTSAVPGSYQVEVIKLAKADKLSGASFASTSTQLGVGGEFYINGRAVELDGTESLAGIRDKINAVNSGSNATGVTATILSTSATQHRLVLTSDATGARGIELADGSTNTLEYLGIATSTTSRNANKTNSANTDSFRFTSKTTALADMLGVTAPPATTTIVIDGEKITVDLENDTLISLMNKVTTAGGSAEIIEEDVNGKTFYRLSVGGTVTADGAASDPAASQDIIELAGFVQKGRASSITTGQDATFKIDGFKMTRRTNTVSDAVTGVTLNLLTANGSDRTSSISGTGLSILTDPQSVYAGSYDIALTTTTGSNRTATTDSADLSIASDPGVADGTYAVALTHADVRSTSTSNPNLSVVSAPGTVNAGTYNVNITQAASVANTTGSGFDGTYYKLLGSDTLTITDDSGNAGSVTLSTGKTIASIVSDLNTAFGASGATLQASAVGNQLKIVATDGAGSNSAFTVTSDSSNVAAELGIANGTYTGTDVAGTIDGETAVGVGQTLTTSSGNVNGLQLTYTGSATGPAGTVTVTDTPTVTGGTINGEAATWDSATNTLTADGASSVAGLAVTYSGTPQTGTVGNVVVSTAVEEYITGATINGQAATWDATAKTITGVAGGDFDGLVIGYTGAATSGSVGTLTVSGEIGVTLDIQRDSDATVAKMNAFATAYNAVVDFYEKQRSDIDSPLYSNGSFRSMQRSLTGALLTPVTGLASTSIYTSGAIAGVALDEKGKLTVDADVLKSAMLTNLNDVQALFGKGGTSTNGQVSYVAGTSATEPGTYAINITSAATLGAHTGSVWSGNYSASDGVSDTLQITDSNSGITVDFVALEGMTISEAITELTELFEGQGLAIVASNDGGALKLSSSEYGSASTFTLSGATAASRLGLTEGTYAGTDVTGTIGGLAATGEGQVLTGDADLVTEGLAIRYTGNGTGSMGSVSYVLGVTGNIDRVIDPFTRTGDGIIASQMSFIDTSVDKLNQRVDDVEARIELRRLSLEQQFIRMEESLAMLNSQGTWLSGQISAMQGNNNNR